MSEDEVFKSLKSMENSKSPRNEFPKELYECFWDEIKNLFLVSIHKSFLNQELSTYQKKLWLECWKKDKAKRLVKDLRPILLFNPDMKIINKVLATRIKNILTYLISSNQTPYVKNRFMSESGRVISHI